MGSEALLHMACELSYVIARNGAESDPPVEAPPAMRDHLYAADLPPEAYEAARDAIEADPAFRRRVAEQASQDEVGRAGYIWLHRPIGWAAEFEELTSQGDEPAEESGDLELVPAIAESQDVEAVHGDNAEVMALVDGAGKSESESLRSSRSPNEADAIEDELTSLRGLVDRLASERKAVSSSVERVEQQVVSARYQPSTFDSDIYTLQSELESANTELEAARREREDAVRQHSAALTRQLALEKELDRARELQAEIERGHSEADAQMVELQEALARAEASIGPITTERDSLAAQVGDLTAKNNSLASEVERLAQERQQAIESAEEREAELRAEADSLRTERTSLEDRLAVTSSELDETTQHLEISTTQGDEAKALVEVLTEEKIEVASRLADTEVMLDNTRTQLGAVKSDLGAATADLATVKTHRDGLSSQVEELHGSLGEALGNLAKVRSISDTDRASLKEVRTERDLLKVRLSSLEQVEAGLEAKLESMASERDALLLKLEESTGELTEAERRLREASETKAGVDAELAQRQRANADLAAVRDQLQTEVEDLRSELTEAEVSRDGLAQQVDQLTAENSAIQDQLVESDRLRVETSESQGYALSELAHRLAIVEDERARLDADLTNARKALERAQSSAQPSSVAGPSVGETLPSPSSFATGILGDGPETVESADADTAPADVGETSLASAPDREAATSVADLEEPSETAGEVASRRGLDDETAEGVAAGPGFDDEVAAEAETASDTSPEASTETSPDDDEESKGDEGMFARTTKRHTWSLAPLLRPGGRSKKPEDQPVNGRQDLDDIPPPVIESEDELDAAATAVADATTGTAEEPESQTEHDDDLHLMGAGSAEPVDEIDESDTSDDDDLDAIGDLISRAVTQFDPSEADESSPTTAPDESKSADDVTAPAATWSLLVPDADEASDDAEELVTPGRGNGVLTPPSIFSDGDDPFASLDQFEAVTIRPEPGSDTGGEQESQTGLGIIAERGETKDSEAKGLDTKGSEEIESADVAVDADETDASEVSSSTSKRSRRQVEIPAELLDDEVELARHVVSSPDVVLLVDGDSVAKMGWPSLPVAQQRDALVSYLADLATSTGAAPDVVFDGRIGEEESLPASRAVRIRLSTPPTEPAAALDELVDAYPEQWPIAVVTDDDALSSSAVDRGAVVLNNGQLLDLFIAQ